MSLIRASQINCLFQIHMMYKFISIYVNICLTFWFRCQNSEKQRCDVGHIFLDSKCQKCPIDTYADIEENLCLGCLPGYDCSSGKKVPCKPGTYYHNGACIDCKANHYCAGGSSDPKKCPIGRISDRGSQRCSFPGRTEAELINKNVENERSSRKKRFSGNR